MTEPAKDPFDNADYYDCREAERLSLESPEECIAEYVDYMTNPGERIAKTLDAIGDLTVTAYNTSVIPEEQWTSWALNLADDFESDFDESEYASPHDCLSDSMGKVKFDRFVSALAKTLKEQMADHAIWACEQVGTRTYTRAEVEAMMRKKNPQWFDRPSDESR